MICYKDQTFCGFWKDCVNGTKSKCFRVLSDADKKRAKEMDLPISQFVDKPKCWEEKKDE